MPQSQTDSHHRTTSTWAILLLACGALVATSAPEPVRISDTNAAASGPGGVDFIVWVSGAGVKKSTSMQISFDLESTLSAEELDSGAQVVARLIPDDTSLATVEVPLTGLGAADEQLAVAGGQISTLAACAEDVECELGFRIDLNPYRDFTLTVTAEIVNGAAGCPIRNPSYGADAAVEVIFE